MTFRNQTRYNNTHREAVVSALGAFAPATETVALLRQGNDRENSITSNQLTAVARVGGARLSHALSAGFEVSGEEQYAPTLAGMGTRARSASTRRIPKTRLPDYDVQTRTLGFSEGRTETAALFLFDTVELASRWQLSGGVRWERYDTNYRVVGIDGDVDDQRRRRTTTWSAARPASSTVCARTAMCTSSWGSSLTPPGTANFTLSTQPNNQNNPNVEPQKSINLEFGSKWDLFNNRLSLTGAIFRTQNENVIYTVDATAVPPLFNQDDAQLVKGVTLAAVGQLSPRWQVLASMGYLDTSLEHAGLGQQRQPADSDAAVLGKHVDDVPAADRT